MQPRSDGERQPVGLCGLGQMGLAVANRLATAYDVVAYDPDEGRRALGREISHVTPVEEMTALQPAGTVVLSLPEPTISYQVCRRLAALLEPGAMVIETSTVLPRDVGACREVLGDAGMTLIDAAILSGVGQMMSGTATLLVGGADGDIATARPVLEVLAARVQRFGELGSGMAAKVVNNAVAHAVMVVLVEALAMARLHDLDVFAIARMLEAPDGGLIRPLTHRIMERVARGDYEGGMPVDAARKDSMLALAMAQHAGVPLFATSAAHTVYDLAVAQGLGRSDYAVIASMWEDWCNVSLAYAQRDGEP